MSDSTSVLHVLLAIPESELRTIVKEVLLWEKDVEVKDVEEYDEALELVATNLFQLVIVDIHMGPDPTGRGGLDIVRKARERLGRPCYNVLMSASYRSRMEFQELAGDNAEYDYFLSTRYTRDADPVAQLKDAVHRARHRVLQLVSATSSFTGPACETRLQEGSMYP